MSKIGQWLRQPYPYDGSWGYQLRVGAYAGLFVLLFLYFFRPFGLGTAGHSEWWLFQQCLYFGIATMLTAWLFDGLRHLFPNYYNEKNWVIGREILSNISIIVLIAIANLLLGHFLYDNDLSVAGLYYTFRNTLLIGLFPIIFSAYANHQRWNRRYGESAQEATALLKPPSKDRTALQLTLRGDNINEELSLAAHELLFIESADNYAKIFLWQDEQLETHLLRATLKALTEQLAEHPQFFRCHRTYLVNLKQVINISGNAQGFKLHLSQTEHLIPVSRKLNQEIHALLPNL